MSRAIADVMEGAWCEESPDEPVVRRYVGLEPASATSSPLSVFADRGDQENLDAEQRSAVDLAAWLATEFLDSDDLLFRSASLQFRRLPAL